MIGCQFSIKINKSPKQTTFRISDFRQQSQFSSNPPNQQKKKKKRKSSLYPSLGENVRRSVDHRRRDSAESGGLDGGSGGRRCRFDDRS